MLGSYTYDATGQRLSDGATEYLYDGLSLLSRSTADSSEQHVYDANGNVIRMLSGENAYIYHKDVRGSIMSIYNVNGTKVLDNSYDAYGNTKLGTATIPNILAYTGAVIDEATGLYYMNARYYDPEIGAFISQDSYRGNAEAFWHLYAYCNGDPVNFYDPTGNIVKKAVCSAGYKYLKKKGYNLAAEMFNHAFYGQGKEPTFVSDYIDKI